MAAADDDRLGGTEHGGPERRGWSAEARGLEQRAETRSAQRALLGDTAVEDVVVIFITCPALYVHYH